ncbi:permease prefix domain 1-containing protein [Actinophytocola oryzae]|uniref:Uncharacterized protein n=1 Tax=Actinophytocola oryzae TaxID=502181 RepID=A0A4R7UW36_9PSEU|nr:permease prefix domain 1-containing protein [Actinophytocola oryzae]TDV40988.1 hypothetical protein CLV71_12154 [Actinophytocola oryzae]
MDVITAHVTALERSLRGPRRTRRDMVSEARDGLRDAAAAYRAGGYSPTQAAVLAVRDFGDVREIAPDFQDELTARQGRLSALLFALAFPAMMLAWDLFLWVTDSRTVTGPPAPLVSALSRIEDAATLVVGAVALALLVASFRRAVSVRRLTRAVGLTGVAGAVLCAGLALAMNVAGSRVAVHHATADPAGIGAYVGSAVVMVLIIWQSLRTLRVARHHDVNPAP